MLKREEFDVLVKQLGRDPIRVSSDLEPASWGDNVCIEVSNTLVRYSPWRVNVSLFVGKVLLMSRSVVVAGEQASAYDEVLAMACKVRHMYRVRYADPCAHCPLYAELHRT